jgi:hypothetical protein
MKYLLYLCIISIFVLLACQSSSDNQPLSQEELITKGEYLVMVGGCNDCHTPKKLTPQGPVPDMSLLLRGNGCV